MTLPEKKALIVDFLARCNRYAEHQITEYRRGLGDASPWGAMELEDKIGHWTAYRAFNAFAIEELGTSALDDWFE
jgi:hypothetical protein